MPDVRPLPEPSDGTPGYRLMVLRDGAAAIDHTAGVGEAASATALEPGSIFYVGSIAKQFVAACVAFLERDGVLGLDDPVSAHVDGLPAWAVDVQVRHLLHHTSGLPDPVIRHSAGVPPEGVPGWGNDDMLGEIREDVPALAHTPGTRYAYSNRGYHLLGHVVAGAAGMPLARVARERLFDPLGMADTFFRDTDAALPAAAVRGHFVAADGLVHPEPARFHAVGAGGLWTTAADLATWDASFFDDPLTGGWLPARLTTHGTLDDGARLHYAWGLSVRTHRGLPIHSHGGSFPGWLSKMVRFPTERTTVIVLANGEAIDVSALAFDVADDVLAERLDPSAAHADATFDGVA